MSSTTVVVIYCGRRATVKAPPTRALSQIHTEACSKLGVDPQNFTLKKGQAILDLSLQVRLTNLSSGARLDLVPAKNRDAPITIILRVQEEGKPIQEFTDTFTASDTIWRIIRKLEAKGPNPVNITERGAPSGSSGSGRLHYVMPVVRVMNREVSGFQELQQTLSGFGIRSGRQLVTLRYRETETPFEVALEEIAVFSGPMEVAPAKAEDGESSKSREGKGVVEEGDDLIMFDSPGEPVKQGDFEVGGAEGIELLKSVEEESSTVTEPVASSAGPRDPNKPVVSVFKPPQSDTLAATQIIVPDKAYEVGITEAKLIQANIKKETIGKRLPSDKEIEEKKAAMLTEAEKVEKVVIKVRFPDGYTSEQIFFKTHTFQDLYDTVRSTLRHQNEPFVLRIPPRETLPEAPKRLTTDLKLKTGATVHLVWGPDVSAKAKKESALNDEFIRNSKSLPAPKEPDDDSAGEGSSKAQGKSREGREGRKGGGHVSKENKLMSILNRGFGKKK